MRVLSDAGDFGARIPQRQVNASNLVVLEVLQYFDLPIRLLGCFLDLSQLDEFFAESNLVPHLIDGVDVREHRRIKVLVELLQRLFDDENLLMLIAIAFGEQGDGGYRDDNQKSRLCRLETCVDFSDAILNFLSSASFSCWLSHLLADCDKRFAFD